MIDLDKVERELRLHMEHHRGESASVNFFEMLDVIAECRAARNLSTAVEQFRRHKKFEMAAPDRLRFEQMIGADLKFRTAVNGEGHG